MKIKMLNRHSARTGEKLETGLQYDLPPDYAVELINHGLAEMIAEPIPQTEPEPVAEVKPEPMKVETVLEKAPKLEAVKGPEPKINAKPQKPIKEVADAPEHV